LGGLFGFKEYLEINEKEIVTVPHTDFRLRVDDFNVEFYPTSICHPPSKVGVTEEGNCAKPR